MIREQEYNQDLMRSYIQDKILRAGKSTAEQQKRSNILMEKSEGFFLYRSLFSIRPVNIFGASVDATSRP
jgi:hypothetical protein